MSQPDGSKDSPIVYFDDNGMGPNLHVCKDGGPAVERISNWLDRERLLGLPADHVALVERIIEDIR